MPKRDKTGPSKSSIGPRDGRGKGRGNYSNRGKGVGSRTGGNRGKC